MGKKQTDEELLKEFEWARDHIPDEAVPEAEPGEREKILERMESGRGK
ncbi:MAG: hypothetical protein LIP16_09075 [Clostridium sp.]|nr:hypothetical protein [Clostridium sp.]